MVLKNKLFNRILGVILVVGCSMAPLQAMCWFKPKVQKSLFSRVWYNTQKAANTYLFRPIRNNPGTSILVALGVIGVGYLGYLWYQWGKSQPDRPHSENLAFDETSFKDLCENIIKSDTLPTEDDFEWILDKYTQDQRKVLYAKGFGPHARETLLHAVARRDATGEIVKLLVKDGAPLNVIDGYELTPLMVAIKHGQPAVVEYLLSLQGQQHREYDGWGHNLLHQAIQNYDRSPYDYDRISDALLRYGIDPKTPVQNTTIDAYQLAEEQFNAKLDRLQRPLTHATSLYEEGELFALGILKAKLDQFKKQ